MSIHPLRTLLLGFVFFHCVPVALGQSKPIKMFLECNCEKNYIRQEIDFISHVRDQDLANVQLNIYDIANGSGGRTYKLDFVGKDVYDGVLLKREYDTNANMTPDEVRKGLAVAIKSGLLRYLVDSDLGENITYQINRDGQAKLQDIDFDDPWNNWIFEVYGAAELEKEASRRNFEYEVGFETDRVTEKWRIRGDFEMSQATSNFVRDEEEFSSSRERYYGFGSVVRSLSDHWSAGIFAGADYNTFNNLDVALNLTPAVEYNIFPYREVLRREIVFAYKIGYLHNDYIETTIFGKDRESLFNHSLDIQVRYRQPWGNLYSRLRASSFLNDFSKNRTQLFGRLSIRIIKGLAVRFSGRVEYIQDQINLPAGDASLEDLLLQQKQIATDFELGFSVGLSYTFGSAFNNIINTRL
ncbi:DUF481 domain-containing protein [Flavobacteriaceae bacterium TP-CH-4]|uniref:DUF481 domain-containing protein n=1 Tax=Pelagihabitans pacificus TaxID=2696054 RepID=A0A967APR4_9FLAO|nr:DUF481 domain-containing protein [Pelagihabitans pacificus]NHF58073.1 DUF481 domain-containing protein [Pelagihabitans pacificus]